MQQDNKDFWEREPVNLQDGSVETRDDNVIEITIPDVWGRSLPPLVVTVTATALGVIVAAKGKWSTIVSDDFVTLTWASEDEDELYRMSAIIQEDLRIQREQEELRAARAILNGDSETLA